jgi:hypothetical protein
LNRSAVVGCLDVLCLALDAFLTYLSVSEPIAGASVGKRIMIIHRGGIGASLGTLLGGLILLIAGRHVERFMVLRWGNATPQQVRGTLLLAVLPTAACIAFEAWFARDFEGLGDVIHQLP